MNITDSIDDKEMITKMGGQLVFEYYDDNGIEVMKKSWDSVDIMKKLLIITCWIYLLFMFKFKWSNKRYTR